MSIRPMLVTPMVAAAGFAAALFMAPAAMAVDDPCASAVSSSRCLGPSGVDGFEVPKSTGGSGGAANGPYGAWGSVPPIG